LPFGKIAFSGHFDRVSSEMGSGFALLPLVFFDENRSSIGKFRRLDAASDLVV